MPDHFIRYAHDGEPQGEIPPRAPLAAVSRMPFAPTSLFVGREDDLRTLARHLPTGATAAITEVKLAVACGMGGIGKTQLAVEFVHRYGRFFEGGVFWLSFADPAALPSEVAACGGTLGLHPAWDSLSLAEQTGLVQEAWSLPVPRLLVFDGCEDEELLAAWRPRSGGARVLVTSRRDRWSRSLGVEILSLSTLPRAKSVELLRKFRPELRGDDPDLEEIARELGDLPLALHIAGGTLGRRERAEPVRPSAYLQALGAGSPFELPSLQGEAAGPSPTGHDLHLGLTFARSTDRLDPADEADSLALALFARAGHFAPGEPIPPDLLRRTAGLGKGEEDRESGEEAVRRLASLGLVESGADGAVTLHPLLAAFSRGLPDSGKAAGDVRRALLAAANGWDGLDVPAPLLAWEAHLRFVALRSRSAPDAVAAGLFDALGFHLQKRGEPSGARLCYERALAILEAVEDAEPRQRATLLNNLGNILREGGELAAARPHLERALAMREKALGSEHPETARSLNSLGSLHRAEGDRAGARAYYERALSIRERELGPEHPDTATSLNNLGFLHREEGEMPAARLCYERALSIREEALGPEHPDTAQSLNNLGSLCQAEGDPAAALPYYERALAIREAVLGPSHPQTLNTRKNLASLAPPAP